MSNTTHKRDNSDMRGPLGLIGSFRRKILQSKDMWRKYDILSGCVLRSSRCFLVYVIIYEKVFANVIRDEWLRFTLVKFHQGNFIFKLLLVFKVFGYFVVVKYYLISH